jgi:hypothetical protein
LFLGSDENFGEWSFRILFWARVEVRGRMGGVVGAIFFGVAVEGWEGDFGVFDHVF